ncbi:hypothetical protein ACEPAH_3253 [Sanghuangporus vaninii]
MRAAKTLSTSLTTQVANSVPPAISNRDDWVLENEKDSCKAKPQHALRELGSVVDSPTFRQLQMKDLWRLALGPTVAHAVSWIQSPFYD